MIEIKRVEAGVLEIAYLEYGPADGWPCIMMHGFPFDAHAYDGAAPLLAAAGARVLVPWVRGYGATRFLSPATPRSGEQAAFGSDLRAFMDALGIERAVVGGYDWGGRACCVVSALWPERVVALVSGNAYNIHHVPGAQIPESPEAEASYWYQYYFHAERGRRGLIENRAGIARTLWRMWSPTWTVDEATFDKTAKAFDNPDFVDVVIHSYRVRYGLVPGDPAYAHLETALVGRPPITVPTIAIDGADDGVNSGTKHHAKRFTGPFEHRVFEGTGHNMPQEQPQMWTRAVLDARAMAEG